MEGAFSGAAPAGAAGGGATGAGAGCGTAGAGRKGAADCVGTVIALSAGAPPGVSRLGSIPRKLGSRCRSSP